MPARSPTIQSPHPYVFRPHGPSAPPRRKTSSPYPDVAWSRTSPCTAPSFPRPARKEYSASPAPPALPSPAPAQSSPSEPTPPPKLPTASHGRAPESLAQRPPLPAASRKEKQCPHPSPPPSCRCPHAPSTSPSASAPAPDAPPLPRSALAKAI